MIKISIEFFSNKLIEIFKEFKNYNLLLKPQFISITYNKNNNFYLIFKIKNYYLNISPHICFTGLNIKRLKLILNYYYLINVKNLVILKGDNNIKKNYYSYNLNLLIKNNYNKNFKIYNGIYTDIHPESFNLISDIKNNFIKNRLNDYFITQYFYNIDSFIFYTKYIKNKWIPAFIINNSINQLIKFSNICKSNLPIWLIKNIGNNLNKKNILNINFNLLLNYILKFIKLKLNKFHFYTLNNYLLTNKFLELLFINLNV